MAFAVGRPNAALLSKIGLSEVWSSLGDPAEGGVCDPLNVRHRMSLYRLLIEGLNPAGALGDHDELSPFWGFASQLYWQHRSGRLSISGESISAESWWGACNYALSIVPYRAAMELGAVPALRFDSTAAFEPPDYSESLERWRRALRALTSLRPGEPMDPTRLEIWGAHLHSIQTAARAHEPLLQRMSSMERRFGRGWVRMVDFFSAAALRTDLAMLVERGTGSLPRRVLRDSDQDGGADLPADERETVRRMFRLADRTAWRWAIDQGLWSRVMRSRAARDDVLLVLRGLFGRGRSAWRGRALALAYGTLPVPLAEAVPKARSLAEWVLR